MGKKQRQKKNPKSVGPTTTPKKARRPRSRGKRRNPATAAAHAINELERAAGVEKRESKTPHDPTVDETPPETFRTGPAVTIFDGSASINREAQLLNAILNHDDWQIPKMAFATIPHKLTKIAMNMGVDEATGELKPESGTWTTNQQLSAMKIIEKLHATNLRKLTALQPKELRLLNDNPAPVTSDEQRAIVLAAILAEIGRRKQGGSLPDKSNRGGVGVAGTREAGETTD